MFISRAEKKSLIRWIELLEGVVNDFIVTFVKTEAQPPEKRKRKERKWTDEDRASSSERMKKYWADRKARKEQV